MKGSCHCGKVHYEISGPPVRFAYCHCHDCRKICGSLYSAAMVLKKEDFRITSGEAELTAYESSPGKDRLFCRFCGTPIYSRMKHKPGIVIIRAGTLDTAPPVRPQMHIWVSAKAPWYEILDQLPQHAEGPPV
jgi:hypothetical protein